MKLVLAGILAISMLGCTKPPEATVAPALAPFPMGLARATPDREPPALLVTVAPETKTFETHTGDATWVRSLARNSDYAAVHAFEAASDDPIELTWLVHPSVRIPGATPGEEYPGLYQAKLELLVRRGPTAVTLAFGEHAGNPEGAALTYCRRKGFRTSGDGTWSFPAEPNVVAAFELATMQGSEDILLVLGRDGIHVLEQHQHDGACPVRVKQGPFEVCADMKWHLAYELPMKGEPRVAETAFHVDDQSVRTPVDCKASYTGESLVAP